MKTGSNESGSGNGSGSNNDSEESNSSASEPRGNLVSILLSYNNKITEVRIGLDKTIDELVKEYAKATNTNIETIAGIKLGQVETTPEHKKDVIRKHFNVNSASTSFSAEVIFKPKREIFMLYVKENKGYIGAVVGGIALVGIASLVFKKRKKKPNTSSKRMPIRPTGKTKRY